MRRGEAALREHLRSQLDAHMVGLGYKAPRAVADASKAPEIVRRNAARGKIAYGETVLVADLQDEACRDRLVAFSKRRTRRRSSILFFVGVVEAEAEQVEKVLVEIGIHGASGGGHVQIVPLPAPD